jgi:hypothetical protein
VLLQVKQEYRARGLDPDQAGWQGMVLYDVKKRLRATSLAEPNNPQDAAQ